MGRKQLAFTERSMMQFESTRLGLAGVFLSLVPVMVFAQDAPQDQPQQDERTLEEHLQAMGIEWTKGPDTVRLGAQAELAVPAGYLATDANGTKRFFVLTENNPSGIEVGLVHPVDQTWFVVFQYQDSGHVKDDDKDDLDADKLLETLKEGNKEENEERRSRGQHELELIGWYKPPFYDASTKNLTWATLIESEGGQSVNWKTRLLGRTGMMNVTLVMGPEEAEAAVPAFGTLLEGFTYREGSRYAEFKSGDRIAEYGLAALVAGGAGVVAAKTGLLAKFWKLIVVAVAAVGAFFKKLFGFGKKTNEDAGPA
jgi:uncharacterized membrane-anchored protein